jgi:S-adenosylmethionine:tRNA ribosyltransferase-isomerase
MISKAYAPSQVDILSTDIAFHVPTALEASEPAEARGLARDEVRLMVTYRSDQRIVHTRFRCISAFLRAGDVLVLNTSGTRNAALPANRADGQRLMLHLSSEMPSGQWLVELRRLTEHATEPFFDAIAGESLSLPHGATVVLRKPHDARRRLWLAELRLPLALDAYLSRYGRPIRYRYVKDDWPTSTYQNVYATELGSAEMPSAGRAFTPELVAQLVARGVYMAPLHLHTGVASQEAGEAPYEERYHVPATTARLINMARAAGGRVIAVGTTVVRALETVADASGWVSSGEGWTDLVVGPQRGVRALDGLLTGLHEAEASHLAILQALAGTAHVQLAYAEALRERYLWHEFGDLHLLLP